MTEPSEGWLTGDIQAQPPVAPTPVAPSYQSNPGLAQPSPWQAPFAAAPVGPQAAPDAVTRPVAYSPAADRRPAWSATDYDAEQAARPPPERWFEPVQEPVAFVPVHAVRATGRGTVVAAVVAAALLSATLASAGTYGALKASGALDPAPVTTSVVNPPAQTAAHQNVVADESSAITAAAAKVNPAIVTITTTDTASATDPFSIPSTGVGSGIIFDANGWIITNHHVVEGGSKLVVKLLDNRTFTGTVYGVDTLTDLAIVKVDATGLPVAPIGDSSTVRIGQTAIAIGSPLGTYTNSVTSGIISGFRPSITVQDGSSLRNLIQTDAPINPGNSGGALLDVNGAVIGINSAVASGEGIGFALEINIAKPIMRQALAGEPLTRPWIGIRYVSIDAQIAQDNKLPVTEGAWLKSADPTTGDTQNPIVAGSPAEKATLKEGDIITAVDGQKITATNVLDDILTQYVPGKTVALDVLRNGQALNLMLTLGTRPANLQ